MTTDRFNVLISSAGRRVGLLQIFRATLERMGLLGDIHAADCSDLAPALYVADHRHLVPRCSDHEFIPAMLDLCSTHEISLLVPTIDTELPKYANHRDRFSAIGTTVAVSSPGVVAVGCDKLKTHLWLEEHRLPRVEQSTICELSSKGWSYPLLVKPRFGSASLGVAVVNDVTELERVTREGEYVVEQIAQGAEFTVDVLANRVGQCVAAVPRRRLEVRAGEVSKGLTVRNPQLLAIATAVCERLLGVYGPLNLQIFLDETTRAAAVIELNPRFGGGFPLAWKAGADFPRWIIEEILGLAPTANNESWSDDLLMLRYDEAIFVQSNSPGSVGH